LFHAKLINVRAIGFYGTKPHFRNTEPEKRKTMEPVPEFSLPSAQHPEVRREVLSISAWKDLAGIQAEVVFSLLYRMVGWVSLPRVALPFGRAGWLNP